MDKSTTHSTKIEDLDHKLILDVRTNTSCDYHRIVMPFGYFTPEPKVPVYMFNRISSHGLDFLYKLKAQGVKIVMDLDDYYQIDPSHYLFQTFMREGMTNHLIANIKLADVVTVTTNLLASKIKHLNSNVVVIPNALPFDQGQFSMSGDTESKSPIVWAGGASHHNDLKLIQNVALSDKITFVGFNPDNTEWIKIKLDHPKVNYEGELRLNEYMRAYDGHKISIAPLTDTTFNSCKSNLKVLEAGAKGLPIVCSKVEPYFNSVDKDFVIYATNKTEWHQALTKLMVYKDYCVEQGQKLAEHVRLQYNLRDANELRRQVIESF